jgi:diphosphomevalonate decarboxylase
MQTVHKMRADGLPAYFTIDAGPHVKVLTTADHMTEVQARLQRVEGVVGVIGSRLGSSATVTRVEQ